MKSASTLTAFLAATLLAAGVNAETNPSRVGDFALLDHQGEFHQLSRYGFKKALVIFSQANSCSATDTAIADLRELRSKWEDKDVAFLMLNASAKDSLKSIRKTAEKKELDFPILLDDSQLVAETLNITKAGEVIVLDPATQNLVYRGPVHEHIGMALDGILSGKPQTGAHEMPVKGCDLSFPAKTAHTKKVPDYARDVAPIIEKQCADCHREGGIGPFAMNSYMMLKGWSPMIREVLLTKRMPPMQVDPHIGQFNNANHIPEDELQTLVHWIDAGSPRGKSKKDPLTSIPPIDLRAWQLGEPDYIVKAPVHEVPATGVLDYINVDVDLEFDEDKWVRAVQFIPGDPAVLHHLLTYVTAPKEDFDGGEGDTRSIARRFLEGYAPGKVKAMEFPEEVGVFIPKGHKLSMQFHYTTNGKATTDGTLLGLYFHDEPPKYELLTRSVSGRFEIPPYAHDHAAAAEYVFEEDVVIRGLRAHMHFRGKDMKFSAELPDGTMKEIMSVPNYSYAWQPTFQLEKPMTLPAGTKVHVTGSFDNSEHNPANPDPSKTLTFGLQTWDEMFIGYWAFHTATPAN
ncbi:redoxin domain-containing protein [Gilvimarinus sp. F26214L]|uniref:redoxin domain-containing protein n=1 Tax=Gilvimarinus sp. DZF01 TaxID=3461371 RepID=UPI0040467223